MHIDINGTIALETVAAIVLFNSLSYSCGVHY